MTKHFFATWQESNRMNVLRTVDRQMLHEIYMLPSEMTVKDG